MELRDAVWRALDTVLDPELDFVESCAVSEDETGRVATVRLRLPTFFCAPNFSFLMVADAYDAVSAVPGVTRADVTLADHHASAEINGGEAAQSGDLDRMRQRRAALGLPHGDDAPLLIDADGNRIPSAQVPLHLRRARLQRVGIETNGEYCKSLLANRYNTAATAPAH